VEGGRNNDAGAGSSIRFVTGTISSTVQQHSIRPSRKANHLRSWDVASTPLCKQKKMLGRQLGSKIWSKARPFAYSGQALPLRYQSSNNQASESIRWKAANALTSSLPEKERNQLLEKLEPKMKEKKSTETAEEERTAPDRSIDEIVAAARAQEAEVHQKRWSTVKNELMKEAEDAARKRVESDLMIQKRQMAFEAWKKDLEKEKSETTTVVKEESKLSVHPILGPVLADLGTKRLHVTSAASLSAIPVWKKQRIYRHSRAKTMASDKMKTLHLGVPGVIGIYESSDGSLSIIDGQHRVGMLKELKEQGPENFDFEQISVEVYSQPDGLDEAAHAQALFLEVNKAEPVKLVDLPGVAKASHRKVINETAILIMERFPDMFSASQRCRAPHLNEDNLRDALFASNVIDRHSIRTTKQLDEWIMKQNEAMGTKFQDEGNQKLVPANALKKADKYGFFLGLGSDWLYN
jgi:hypothetical protein